MATKFTSKEDALKNSKWWIVDATNVPVGRLASQVATLIRGKHRPDYTPNVDGGDFVIVVNAEKIRFTGDKLAKKMYRHHTGFMGGLKEIVAQKLLTTNPERVIELAVAGMLPEGILGHRMKGKLKVYVGGEHPHAPQMPQEFKVAA